MIMKEEREKVIEYCKKLITNGLTKGTGGNISIYNDELKLMAISPSSMDYFTLIPEDIVVLDLDGNKVEGDRKPSSEYDMHRAFYKKRPDVKSVVHCHSTYTGVLACLHWDLKPIHYLIGFAGKSVKCTPYKLFGSPELAEVAVEYCEDRNAVLLGNHGLVAVGETVELAFDTAEETEFVAELYYKAKCVGEPISLTEDEMDTFFEKFRPYGAKVANK